MSKPTIPILLLTGYLGSGKTTLVNRILANEKGIKFAVIVNDIGEVNIDASLIERGGVVGQSDDSLVALQNGCICCTLKMDLIKQIADITKTGRFDYIVIEASGICEPVPIAQTICSIPSMGGALTAHGTPKLDCICCVVDALRLRDEFACGKQLQRQDIDDEDIENLLIQQIEFCNIILLNKAAELTPEELGMVKATIRAIQPQAEIIETNYCDIDLNLILNTHKFDFDKVATSAAWIHELEKPGDEIHDHDHSEAELEYGIGTFVYYRRKPFDLNKFDYLMAKHWGPNIIRSKGVVYFKENPDMSYLFEQAGSQKNITEAGKWFATAPADELIEMMRQEPGIMRDWDEHYGDRMQKIVIIGRDLDQKAITRQLDDCLA